MQPPPVTSSGAEREDIEAMTAIQAFCKRTGRKEYDTSAYKLDREATKAFLAWTRTKDPPPCANRTSGQHTPKQEES
jgi:hypothetical protein